MKDSFTLQEIFEVVKARFGNNGNNVKILIDVYKGLTGQGACTHFDEKKIANKLLENKLIFGFEYDLWVKKWYMEYCEDDDN